MLEIEAQYAGVPLKLKLNYVGQYVMRIVRMQYGEGLPSPKSQERVPREAHLSSRAVVRGKGEVDDCIMLFRLFGLTSNLRPLFCEL
jgi:hypothetical protein